LRNAGEILIDATEALSDALSCVNCDGNNYKEIVEYFRGRIEPYKAFFGRA